MEWIGVRIDGGMTVKLEAKSCKSGCFSCWLGGYDRAAFLYYWEKQRRVAIIVDYEHFGKAVSVCMNILGYIGRGCNIEGYVIVNCTKQGGGAILEKLRNERCPVRFELYHYATIICKEPYSPCKLSPFIYCLGVQQELSLFYLIYITPPSLSNSHNLKPEVSVTNQNLWEDLLHKNRLPQWI